MELCRDSLSRIGFAVWNLSLVGFFDHVQEASSCGLSVGLSCFFLNTAKYQYRSTNSTARKNKQAMTTPATPPPLSLPLVALTLADVDAIG